MSDKTFPPIIHKMAEAYKLWYQFIPNIPKTARYTIVTKIDHLFIEILENLLGASASAEGDKIIFITNASKKLDTLKFLLMIVWEIKAIDNKKYLALSEKLEIVGKMLGGWLKSIKQK